ncbi:MAG: choice-of-anchor L domain-containing protein [Bacteroidales bacterium]
MKKFYIFSIFCFFIFCMGYYSFGQKKKPLLIKACTSKEEAKQLVKDVLLKGLEKEGLISHVKIIGKPEQIGYYTNGEELGFDTPSGIIISTGKAENTMGGNDSSSEGTSMKGGGDADCQKLAKQDKTYDAAGIVFYFYPAGNTMKFNYIFGSEEYHEYVPKMAQREDPKVNLYNDAFGFFLSSKEDDKINGEFGNNAKNIALVPLTNDYVAVKALNCGYEGKHKIPPPGKKPGGENAGNNCQYLFHNDKAHAAYPECDAYTLPLIAQQSVVLCKRYQIKMVVADSRDGAYDSMVFLEEGSFNVGNVKTKLENSSVDVKGVAVKDCNEVKVKFFIPEQLDIDLKIPITYVDPEGLLGKHIKKDNELGYCMDEVVIYQSQKEASTIVQVLDDQWDGKEYKYIRLEYPTNVCNKGEKAITNVSIRKINPLEPKIEVTFDKDDAESKYVDPEISLECFKPAKLKAQATGGYSSIKFHWTEDKNGIIKEQDGDKFEAYGDRSSKINLKVEGLCLQEERNLTVKVGDVFLTLPEDKEVCLNEENLEIIAETNSPLEFIKWKDGDGNLLAEKTKTYTIPVVDDDMLVICEVPDGCLPEITQTDTIKVFVKRPFAEITPAEGRICPNETIELTANEGISYLWSTGETTRTIVIDPDENDDTKTEEETLDIWVEVTDKCNNPKKANATINIKWGVKATITCSDEDRLICGGDEVQLHGEGGTEVQWINNGAVVSTERDITVSPKEDMYMVLEVKDFCTDRDDITINVAPTPKIDLEEVKIKDCTPAEILIKNHTLCGGNPVEYEWTMDGKYHSSDEDFEIILEEAGAHKVHLKATSDNGCTDKTDSPIEIEGYPHPESNIIHDYTEFLLNRQDYYFKSETDNPEWIYDWLISGPTTTGSMQGSEVAYEFKEHGEFNIVLTITNKQDCSSEFKLEFLVQKLTAFAWIPTAFTPNNDGKNDEFYVQTMKKALDEFKLEIYNRWGEMIYSTTDPEARWDGRVNGEYVDPGAYAVKVNITSIEGEKGEQKQLLFVVR